MENLTTFLYVLSALGILSILILKIVSKNVKKGDKTAYRHKSKTQKTSSLYRFYKTFPLTQKSFYKVRQKVKILYPADDVSINNKTVKDLTLGYLISFGCLLFVLLTNGGSILYICVGVTVAAVIGIQFREGSLKKASKKLLEQTADMIESVIHHYGDGVHVVKDPGDALHESMDEIEYEVGLHVEHIFKIISSPDLDQKIDEYSDIAPNTYLQLFASICAVTSSNGDVIDDNGRSVFVKNLEILKRQVGAELLKVQEMDFRFKMFNIICLLPTLLVKAIELWATTYMPEMGSFYFGSAGIKSMIAVFAVTIFCYNMIATIKNEKIPKAEDDGIWFKIANHRLISPILSLTLNGNYSKTQKIYDLLRLTGSQIGTKAFLMKRIVFGVIAFLLVQVVLVSSIVKDRGEILRNFQESYESSFVLDADYEAAMEELSVMVTGEIKDQNLSKEEITTYIKENTEVTNNEYATMMGLEIHTRLEKLGTIYYHWYYILFGLLGSYVGFMLPFFMLNIKKKNISIEMENEILQFQMAIMILMNRKDVSVNTVLEWMDKFAFCFKTSISECLMNIGNERVALKTLKESESYKPFVELVDSLIAVDDSSLKVAFSQLDTNADFLLNKRDLNNKILIQKVSKQGQLFAAMPILVEIGIYLILPLMTMSGNVMSTLQGSVGTF